MPAVLNTVLLVEDNSDDAVLTVRAFKRSNPAHPIFVVQDGIEALDFLFARGAFGARAGAALPKLVVLDLKLPRLDGLGVLKAIRNEPCTRLVPVVILTSSSERRDLAAGYALGANSYLLKPIDFEQFVATARVLGDYWLMMNQPAPALAA